MARILLLGSSGLVGREALRLALDHGEVDHVIAPTRIQYQEMIEAVSYIARLSERLLDVPDA